jgi:hypothetical protein
MVIAMPAAIAIIAAAAVMAVITPIVTAIVVTVAAAIPHELDAILALAQADDACRRGRCGSGRTADCRSQCQETYKYETLHPIFLLAASVLSCCPHRREPHSRRDRATCILLLFRIKRTSGVFPPHKKKKIITPVFFRRELNFSIGSLVFEKNFYSRLSVTGHASRAHPATGHRAKTYPRSRPANPCASAGAPLFRGRPFKSVVIWATLVTPR